MVQEPRPFAILPQPDTPQLEGPQLPPVDIRPGRPQLPPNLLAAQESINRQAAGLEERLQNLQSQIPTGLERIIQAPTRRGLPPSSDVPGAAIGQVIGRAITGREDIFPFTFEPTEEEEKSEIAFQSLAADIQTTTDALYRSVWQSGVLNALPVWEQAGLVKSPEDIFTLTDFTLEPTATDKLFIEVSLKEVQEEAARREEAGARTLEALEEEGGRLQDLLAINPNTVASDKLVNRIIQAGQFQLPEGLTVEQMRTTLIQMGLTEEVANKELFDAGTEAFRLQAELKQWSAMISKLKEEGARLQSGEIVSAIRKAQWIRALSQPGLTLLRPVEWWSARVSQPFAGRALELASKAISKAAENEALALILDEEEANKYLEVVNAARAEGLEGSSLYRTAFENWDTNWAARLTLEVIADPLSYIGFGLYTKLAKPIPYLGRGVGVTEYGLTRASEIPFEVLAETWRAAIPKTIRGAALDHTKATFDLLRHAVESASNGVPIYKMQPGALRASAHLAIDEAVRNPQALDEFTRAGKGLLGKDALDLDEVTNLARELGINLSDEPITPAVVDEINDIFEWTEGSGVTRVLKPDEAADYINLKIFGRASTDAEHRTTRDWLRNRQLRNINRAKAIFNADTVDSQLRNMSDRLISNFIDVSKKEIQLRRLQKGLIGASLNGLDSLTRRAWIDTVDKYITQKFARVYLVFGFYGPMNVLEAGIKTALSGSNPFWRGDLDQKIGLYFHAIQGHVPQDMFVPRGFSLGEAMPVDELRILSTTAERRISTSRLNIPRRVVDRYSRAWDEGRTLKTLGQDLQTVTGYNWGNRVTAAQIQNYFLRTYLRELSRSAPDIVSTASELIARSTRNFDSVMNKDVARGYREALFAALLSGNRDLLSNIPKVFTPGKVLRGQAAKRLDKYTELPSDIIDFLASRAETGEVFTNPAEIEALMRERIFSHVFTSTDLFESSYKEMLDDILDEPVRSLAEFNVKVNIVSDTVEVFNDTVSNTLAAAVHYARGLRDSRATGEFYNELWNNRISPQVARISRGLDDVVERLRRQLGNRDISSQLQGPTRDAYNALLDGLIRKVEVYRRARVQQQAVRARFFERSGDKFVPVGRGRDAAWWEDFYSENNAIWDAAGAEVRREGTTVLNASARLSNEIFPTIPDVTRRGLSTQDVARLYGVHPTDLERGMYLTEIQALRGREDFIARTRDRATLSAQQSGLDRETLGWTNEAIGQVYDSIMEKIMDNPRIRTGIEPLDQQLKAAIADLANLGYEKGTIIGDSAQAVLQEALEEISQAFRASIGEVRGTVRVGQGPGQIIFRPQLEEGLPALPSGEARLARERSLVTQLESQVRQSAQALQDEVTEFKDSVRRMTRRNATAVGSRLSRLRDRGIDIRIVDAQLNDFLSLRFAGESQAVRNARQRAWENVIDALNTLDIDVERIVQREVSEFRANLTPGGLGPEQAAELTLSQRARIGRTQFRAQLRRETEEQFPGGPRLTFDKIFVEPESVFVGMPEAPFVPIQAQSLEDRISNMVRYIGTDDWQQVRTNALEITNTRRRLDFPDYENVNWFNSTMKMIYPFWGYEAHRWAWWLPREAARHPGVWAAWGKYNNNTDQGYIHIPGTAIEINPLRGTIFQGGFRRLQQRDFPEFYDTFQGAAEVMDYGSRWGFYPGAPFTVLQGVYGSKYGKPQTGELLPATVRTAFVDIPGAAIGSPAERLRQIFFNDRFRDFQIAQEVSRLELEKTEGINGIDILEKRILGEELTPEEDQVWRRAARGIATWSLLFEQTGLFRLRPEEKIEAFRASNELLAQRTGLAPEHFETLYRSGLRFEDIFGALDPQTRRELRMLERVNRFSGGSITLQPSGEGRTRALIRQFWDTVEEQNTQLRSELEQQERLFFEGRISIDEWLSAKAERSEKSRQLIDNLRSTELFKDVPVTLEERRKVAEERGINLVLHPLDELLALYFSKELEDIVDIETGRIVPDFDGLYSFRNVIENSLPENQARQLREQIAHNDTPLEALHARISRQYLRPYNQVKDLVLTEFSPEEQRLIRRWRTLRTLQGREQEIREIQDTPHGADSTLIAEYQRRVRTVRQNLRVADPELDMWLRFFGKVQVSASQESEQLYNDLLLRMQVSGLP